MRGVVSIASNPGTLLDEAPLAYKDIDEVIFTLVDAGITEPVVKLKPLGVFKGEGD
ncbi:MAG: RtcB family protein [Halanaerobiales bacterium]